MASVIVTVFVTNSENQRLYLHPEIIDLIYSFMMTLNFILNLTWIFVWDREEMLTATVLLIFIAITNVIALGVMARRLSYDNHELMRENSKLYW